MKCEQFIFFNGRSFIRGVTETHPSGFAGGVFHPSPSGNKSEVVGYTHSVCGNPGGSRTPLSPARHRDSTQKTRSLSRWSNFCQSPTVPRPCRDSLYPLSPRPDPPHGKHFLPVVASSLVIVNEVHSPTVDSFNSYARGALRE